MCHWLAWFHKVVVGHNPAGWLSCEYGSIGLLPALHHVQIGEENPSERENGPGVA